MNYKVTIDFIIEVEDGRSINFDDLDTSISTMASDGEYDIVSLTKQESPKPLPPVFTNLAGLDNDDDDDDYGYGTGSYRSSQEEKTDKPATAVVCSECKHPILKGRDYCHEPGCKCFCVNTNVNPPTSLDQFINKERYRVSTCAKCNTPMSEHAYNSEKCSSFERGVCECGRIDSIHRVIGGAAVADGKSLNHEQCTEFRPVPV